MAGEDQLFQRFGREFPKGHILFREGDPGKEMYVIQTGKVNITKKVRETEKILATLGAGEFFGEMAILNNKPRSAGAVMAENGKLLVIDPRTFEAMIRGNVEIAVRLIKKLSDRLQEADQQIENLLLKDSAGRVGLSVDAVQAALDKIAKARIILLQPDGVVVPGLGKMQKYLEFLEMKERFGDT